MLLKKIINFCLDVIFPLECLGCQTEAYYLCPDCFKNLTLIKPKVGFNNYIAQIISAGDYNLPLLQAAVQGLKFKYLTGLAAPLAQLLINSYQSVNKLLESPLVIPVPLHAKRFLERGFNQADLIAKVFARHYGYEYCPKLVCRQRNTPHQVGLNKNQRLSNVIKAFVVSYPEAIKNRNVIIIDDVLTTGATLTEIAKILKQSEAQEIWALTLAKD